jgi:hypothetical protein
LRATNPIETNQKLSYSCSIAFYPSSYSFYPKFCHNPNLLFFLRPSGD